MLYYYRNSAQYPWNPRNETLFHYFSLYFFLLLKIDLVVELKIMEFIGTFVNKRNCRQVNEYKFIKKKKC